MLKPTNKLEQFRQPHTNRNWYDVMSRGLLSGVSSTEMVD